MNDAPHAVVVSDVHVGSKHCLHERFTRFLRDLRPGVALVLNGDSVSRCRHGMPPEHEAVVRGIVRASFDRRVVWVRGNHDESFAPDDRGRIEFCDSHSIGNRLFVTHGHEFDNVMPRHRLFIRAFRAMHRLRVCLGAPSVHVAFYAKKWKLLYGVLRRHVAMNAVEHAIENGYEAVACGHTHCVEDVTMRGVRYINTGSWTEAPLMCIDVTPDDIRLRCIQEGAAA